MIILVNGPAGSGKDTVGHILAYYFLAAPVKFAGFLKERAHALYGFPNAKHDAFEDTKDEPQDYLYGKTWRDIYIALSEEFYKPLYGDDFFGQKLADEIVEEGGDGGDLFVVTDSGFHSEAWALMDRLEGEHQFRLILIERPGHGFDGDSRNYIKLPGVETSIISNNGGMVELVQLVKAWGRKHVGEINVEMDS